MLSREERQELRAKRQILVTRDGRCRFCGQWVSPTNAGHTTFDRLAGGQEMCTGKPKGPYRIGVSITKNGLNPNTYLLTAAERMRYADVVTKLTERVKSERGARATEWVQA
jgi:hypothetical protein